MSDAPVKRKRIVNYLRLTNGQGEPWQVLPERQDRLRGCVRMYYDMQALRIAAGNRIEPVSGEMTEPYLDDDSKGTLGRVKADFKALELRIVKVVEAALSGAGIATWLMAIDGIGPCMAGVLLSEISLIPTDRHPDPFSTVSKLWKFTGLHTGEDGKSVRRKRGERAGFNPWLRAKVTAVLARNLIKTNTRAEPNEERLASINASRQKKAEGEGAAYTPITVEGWRKEVVEAGFARRISYPWMSREAVYVRGPWAPIYYENRHRLESRTVDRCMGCEGTGHRADPDASADEKRAAKKIKCWNCNATGGAAPWGRGPDHRDQAAVRYLAKMFLSAFINEYRRQEGLEVRPSYSEAKLGAPRHGGGVQRDAGGVELPGGYVEAFREEADDDGEEAGAAG